MGQSLSQIYVHLVFGTKYRYPSIKNSIDSRLHAYIAGILRNYESPAVMINSVPDHIHILFQLSKRHALSKIVEVVKKQSSKWMKEICGNKSFSWQIGYGAFSVNSVSIENVRHYIENQKYHHKTKSFIEELEEYIEKYGVLEYDGKYFWV